MPFIDLPTSDFFTNLAPCGISPSAVQPFVSFDICEKHSAHPRSRHVEASLHPLQKLICLRRCTGTTHNIGNPYSTYYIPAPLNPTLLKPAKYKTKDGQLLQDRAASTNASIPIAERLQKENAMESGSGSKSRKDDRPRRPLRSNSLPGSRPPPTQAPSRKASSASLRGTGASASKASADFVNEIRHEVMVSYLYQQQCSHSWAGKKRQLEGCLVRKARGEYQTCPTSLITSSFATSMKALNVQVRQNINVLFHPSCVLDC